MIGDDIIELSYKTYEDIKITIADLLDDYGISSLPVDVYSLAKKMGIDVVYASQICRKRNYDPILLFQYPESYLIYNEKKQRFCVYIDDIGTTKIRQRFSLSHEIMHVARGHTEQNERTEAEANFGASYLLVPSCLGLLDESKILLSNEDLVKDIFEVSNDVAKIGMRYMRNRKRLTALPIQDYENRIIYHFKDTIESVIRKAV